MRLTRSRVAITIGIALTFLIGGLQALDEGHVTFILLVPPTIVAAYIGGWWPGVITTVVSTLWGTLLTQPTGSVMVASTRDLFRLVALLVIGIAIAATYEALHRSRRRMQQLFETTRATDERLEQLATSINEVFWLTDLTTGEIVYVSPAFERVWGRSADSVGDSRLWLETIHPDDRERAVDVARAHASGTYTQRYRIVRPDGAVRWIQDRAFPVRNAAGEVYRMAGVAQDITDQLVLQESLQKAQKLESIGLLAGGVAHDFNNILCVITGNVDFMLDEATLTADEREALEEIETAAKRAATITRQLLAFGRKQVSKPVVLDLNETIHESHRMIERMIGEDVSLEVTLDPMLGRVRVDPAQITQVVMNLCVNARDVLAVGGHITIATRATRSEAILVVSDNGPGMTDDVKGRVFEPFFTTKAGGNGTGLGLPVVYGIVQEAGGQIELDSTLGVGTTFTIRLPIVDQPITVATKPRRAATVGTERVLLVDDDASLRATAARTLRRHGYDVTEAGSGADALQVLRREAAFGLMITDVVMPGMNGRQLVENAAQEGIAPPRILYMSGYTDDVVMRRGIQQADVAFLEKPFAGEALTEKVRDVLDAATGAKPVLTHARRESTQVANIQT